MLCPICGTELGKELKKWFYHKGYYEVKLYHCNICKKNISEYCHDNVFSHTIPRYPVEEARIMKLLRSKRICSVEELASRVGITVSEVEKILINLEKQGKVEKVSK